jgi:hypothetical protein
VVYTVRRIAPPLKRRACFEVAGWDGLRWVVEGVFDTGAEAAGASRHVLGRRLGVQVTEEAFSDREGAFKRRVVFAEYRDGVQKPARHTAAAAVVTPRPRRKRSLAGADDVLYVAISALVISIISMVFSIAR